MFLQPKPKTETESQQPKPKPIQNFFATETEKRNRFLQPKPTNRNRKPLDTALDSFETIPNDRI